MDGRRKNVTSSTIEEQTSEAICVRPPTSALMRDLGQKFDAFPIGECDISYLVMDPYAGSVPGRKDPTMFPAPKATSSRFGLIE